MLHFPWLTRRGGNTEVARRWWTLCPRRKNRDGTAKEPTESELNSIRNDPDKVRVIRRRLSDISWWMRLLCQHVGQRANRETRESGKFWESRFRAVRLLDESALLACVAYVDLNPIRAALAETIEVSDFTSAKKRLEALLMETAASASDMQQPATLPDASLAAVHNDELRDEAGPQPSAGGKRCSDKGFLNMTSAEYLELLDWTARQIVPGKAGSTLPETPPILERVGLKPASWIGLVSGFGELFHNVAGRPHEIASVRSLRRNIRYRVRADVQAVYAA